MNKQGFNSSKLDRECRKCGERHKIGYVTYQNKTTHLTMFCVGTNSWCAIKFEPALPIPSVLSEPAKKYNTEVKNLNSSLFVKTRLARYKTSKENLPQPLKPY